MEYVGYEENFWQGKVTNEVNVKRAKYWLMKASEVETERSAEILITLAKAEYNLEDYGKAFDTIVKAEKYIHQLESNLALLSKYYLTRGDIALINGDNSNAVDSYNQSIRCADNQEDRVKLFSKTLSALHNLSISTEDLVASNFEYQNLFANLQPYNKFNGFGGIVRNGRRIKIGYVSPNFKQSADFPFTYGVVACHDKDYFEVTAYSLASEDDAFTKAIVPMVEHFERVSDLSTKKLAQKIHDDQIDILIDLAGHSAGTGLPVFAYRPAPIQISGIGAPSTSGLNTINYFITDKQIDPPEMHDKFFKETFIYMPCQFCYASNSEAPQPVPPPSIESGHITFAAFHEYNRIGDDMLTVWKEILNRLPNSKLILRAKEFSSDSLIDSAYSRLKGLGFNMDFVSFLPLGMDTLTDYQKVDIALDTFPRSDAMATFDAMFMGVPVVSYYDERRDSRFSMSILQNIGLGGFAVTNGNEYVERAVGLANDQDALKMLRNELRQRIQRTNAVQPRHYTKILEQCYEQIIRQFQ